MSYRSDNTCTAAALSDRQLLLQLLTHASGLPRTSPDQEHLFSLMFPVLGVPQSLAEPAMWTRQHGESLTNELIQQLLREEEVNSLQLAPRPNNIHGIISALAISQHQPPREQTVPISPNSMVGLATLNDLLRSRAIGHDEYSTLLSAFSLQHALEHRDRAGVDRLESFRPLLSISTERLLPLQQTEPNRVLSVGNVLAPCVHRFSASSANTISPELAVASAGHEIIQPCSLPEGTTREPRRRRSTRGDGEPESADASDTHTSFLSTDEEDGNGVFIHKKRKYNHESFALKLHRCITDCEAKGRMDVIAFLDGDQGGFQVRMPNIFAAQIMPNYFRCSTWSSFRRQLFSYRFPVEKNGFDERVYSHPLFRRGRLDLCSLIRRDDKYDTKMTKSTKDKKGKKTTESL